MLFRIRKGTHISHFKESCPLWPRESYYEQSNPLWWGNLCVECLKLADTEVALLRKLRKRASRDGMKIRKADLILAGLYLLSAMEDDPFRNALAAGRVIGQVGKEARDKRKAKAP